MRVFFTTICFLSFCGFSQADTLNQTDSEGKKYGYWIVYGKDKPGKGFCDTCKIEEGRYLDNRRHGWWKKYNPDGTIRLEGEYKEGRPHSPHGYKKFESDSVIRETSGKCF